VPSTAYFAYGRNMSAAAMRAACPDHRLLGRAELRDHRLAFRRRSARTGTGVADVVPTPGQSVWGALYEVDEQGLEALDRKEGRGWAYERRSVSVLLDGTPRDAFAYFVITPDAPHVEPSAEYLGALLEGARECGLPAAYIELLAALGRANTADLSGRDATSF
jgi:gamma-glutamylcyclotransferase